MTLSGILNRERAAEETMHPVLAYRPQMVATSAMAA